MENMQQVPNQNPISSVPPLETYPMTQPTPTRKTPWIIIALIVALLGVASYFGYQTYQLKKQLTLQKPTPTPMTVLSSPEPTTSPVDLADSTADWKTYTNTRFNYQIKYPRDWIAKSVEPGPQPFELVNTSRGFIVYPNVYSGVADAKAYITIETEGPENTAYSGYNDWLTSVSQSTFFKGVPSQSVFNDIPSTIVTGNYDGYGFPAIIKAVYLKSSDSKTYFSITTTLEQNSPNVESINKILSTFKFTK